MCVMKADHHQQIFSLTNSIIKEIQLDNDVVFTQRGGCFINCELIEIV